MVATVRIFGGKRFTLYRKGFEFKNNAIDLAKAWRGTHYTRVVKTGKKYAVYRRSKKKK